MYEMCQSDLRIPGSIMCGTNAGSLRTKSRPSVYESSVLCDSYTFLLVRVLKKASASSDLCMNISISKNDTQLFPKSCVSFSDYAGAIHKRTLARAHFNFERSDFVYGWRRSPVSYITRARMKLLTSRAEMRADSAPDISS